MSGRTQGPWTTDNHGGVYAMNDWVQTVAKPDPRTDVDEARANAALIAAAPAMFEALEKIETEAVGYLSYLRKRGKTNSVVAEIVNQSQAAIAKANGENP